METGTLKELNVQPGDVVQRVGWTDGGDDFIGDVYDIIQDRSAQNRNGGIAPFGGVTSIFRIISRATHQPDLTGPVRTVTRKEILPGVYGHVWVGDGVYGTNSIETAAELRAAIATLTQIADALEDQA